MTDHRSMMNAMQQSALTNVASKPSENSLEKTAMDVLNREREQRREAIVARALAGEWLEANELWPLAVSYDAFDIELVYDGFFDQWFGGGRRRYRLRRAVLDEYRARNPSGITPDRDLSDRLVKDGKNDA